MDVVMAAAEDYRLHFPNRLVPTSCVSSHVYWMLSETGKLPNVSVRSERKPESRAASVAALMQSYGTVKKTSFLLPTTLRWASGTADHRSEKYTTAKILEQFKAPTDSKISNRRRMNWKNKWNNELDYMLGPPVNRAPGYGKTATFMLRTYAAQSTSHFHASSGRYLNRRYGDNITTPEGLRHRILDPFQQMMNDQGFLERILGSLRRRLGSSGGFSGEAKKKSHGLFNDARNCRGYISVAGCVIANDEHFSFYINFTIHYDVKSTTSSWDVDVEQYAILREDYASQTTKKGYIIDPTIRIETGSSQPEDVNKENINIYLPTVDYFKAKYQLEDIEVIGLLIGAHGVIPKFFESFRKTFELPQTLTADIITSVLKRSCQILSHHIHSV
ncbi:hypothetical protein ANN_23994 [Periplaneta americana]|uniref:Uncharacterized protein n=1 Tax=Periplaneta americana TaxID=6978 RepID=A0ABQ8S257_PERAM|nr:hypothetical protein ANN_23994 [Periplaneta americana]